MEDRPHIAMLASQARKSDDWEEYDAAVAGGINQEDLMFISAAITNLYVANQAVRLHTLVQAVLAHNPDFFRKCHDPILKGAFKQDIQAREERPARVKMCIDAGIPAEEWMNDLNHGSGASVRMSSEYAQELQKLYKQ
jgi:hypothetical protein